MADNVTANAGSGGAVFATDDVSGVHYPIVKLAFGALDTATLVTSSAGVPVGDAGGSLTIDNSTLSVVGGGTEATALRVTLASDSTGLVSVDDNGGSITVDNGGTFAVQAAQSGTWNITNVSGTVSLPTGAATAAKQPALGTAGTASADVITVQGVASMTPLQVADNGSSLTIDNATLSVTGGGVEASALRVTIASDSTGVLSVDDNGGSLTVDNAALSVTGGGVEASALRVTIANDSTGVVSVDDNGGSLTVDGSVSLAAALPAGTNNIGDVDILSIAAGDNNIGNVDIVTQPARARTTDTIASADSTDAIMNGTTAITPKFVIIDCASSGDNTILAAVASKKIRVVSLMLVAAGTTTVRFESGAGGTALTGQMNLIANTGFTLPYCPVGWFETASNTLLNLELSAAVSVDGCLTYIEV